MIHQSGSSRALSAWKGRVKLKVCPLKVWSSTTRLSCWPFLNSTGTGRAKKSTLGWLVDWSSCTFTVPPPSCDHASV